MVNRNTIIEALQRRAEHKHKPGGEDMSIKNIVLILVVIFVICVGIAVGLDMADSMHSRYDNFE